MIVVKQVSEEGYELGLITCEKGASLEEEKLESHLTRARGPSRRTRLDRTQTLNQGARGMIVRMVAGVLLIVVLTTCQTNKSD